MAVDDKRGIVKMVAHYFQAEYEMLTAYSGEEALQKLAAQTDTLQLVAVPVSAIGEAALVSVARLPVGDCHSPAENLQNEHCGSHRRR